MFELNLATLPNSVLYIEGVQLSYIKVYVQIFNLWYSNKLCFISNAEFAKRTGLHRDTVINAIQFFEKNGILKRVQKGTRRYLVQTSRFIEISTEAVDKSEIVDKSEEISTNIGRGSELDQGGVGVRPPGGSELDHHNNKINNKKLNKSFCEKAEQKEPRAKAKEPKALDKPAEVAKERAEVRVQDEKAKDKAPDKKHEGGRRDEWKETNKTRHAWADKSKEPPTADVTKQSTSYDPSRYQSSPQDTNSPSYKAFIQAFPYLRRKYERLKSEESSTTERLS